MSEIYSETIIIEGPSGAGKTSVAQNISKEYGYANFNSGMIFRAYAAAMITGGANFENEALDFAASAEPTYDLSEPEKPLVAIDGVDVSGILQNPNVSRRAIYLGNQAPIASLLEKKFDLLVSGGRVVVEGKNLAGRVKTSPDNQFFLNADFRIRACRKWQQAITNGNSSYTYNEALSDTNLGDVRDSHMLTVKSESKVIDTSSLTVAGVVSAVMHSVLASKKRPL